MMCTWSLFEPASGRGSFPAEVNPDRYSGRLFVRFKY